MYKNPDYWWLVGDEAAASEAAHSLGWSAANYAEAYGGTDELDDDEATRLATFYGVDESFIRSAYADGVEDFNALEDDDE